MGIITLTIIAELQSLSVLQGLRMHFYFELTATAALSASFYIFIETFQNFERFH